MWIVNLVKKLLFQKPHKYISHEGNKGNTHQYSINLSIYNIIKIERDRYSINLLMLYTDMQIQAERITTTQW